MVWTKWKSLTDLKDIPNKSGIYKISMKINGKVYPIQRVLKDDEEGVLYIGKHDSNINIRLNRFLNALDKGQNHIAADRLHDWREDGKIKFDNRDVQYSYRVTPSNKSSKDEEEKELINYESEFGQFPPLNRKLPEASPRCCK